jgi:zinc protease
VIESPEAMAAAPVVGPLPTVALPAVTEFTLDNGLQVVAAQRSVAPIVSAALMIRSGSGTDPRAAAGLSSLTAEMLDEGAGARDALELADALERLGADLWLGSGRDGSQISLQAPHETFLAGLDIAADVLLRPRLAKGDWERVLGDRRTGVAQRRDQPEAVVNVVSDRLLFGEDHPYGLPTDGLERTVGAIRLDDVRAFHDARYRPEHAFLVVAGAFDAATLRADLERVFGGWRGAPSPASPTAPPFPARPRLVIVDRPDAPQSIVRMVAPGLDRLSPSRPGLSMANAILGGSFTSRLNFNLREKHGYTYGAASSFSFLRHAGNFAARAAVFAESTAPAVREMLNELGGLRERPITDEEIAKARATLLMRVAEGLATTGGIAATFGEIGLYQLPLDDPMRFVDQLGQVTPAALQALAAQHIDPDAVAIVIVGDRKRIEPELRALGLPEPVIRDADGEFI